MTSTTTQYKDINGKVEATSVVNSDGSGYVQTVKASEVIRFGTSATLQGVQVTTAGDVAVGIKTSGGEVDTVSLTGTATVPVVVMAVNGHSFTDSDQITDINTNADGSVIVKSNVPGFAQSTLTVSNAGAATYALGTDSLNFAAGTLTALAGNAAEAAALKLADTNSGMAFGLASAATGFAEDISWNATTGKLVLNLTNTSTGKTFSTSLGSINPGDALKVTSNSTMGLYDASGHQLNGTKINADGSQVDTNYNVDGSVASVYNYNAAGNLTSIITSGVGTLTNYYDSKGVLQAVQQVNVDGSGYVYDQTAGGTIRFAAGSKETVSMGAGSAGDVHVDLTAANGVKDSIDMAPYGGSTIYANMNINGHTFIDSSSIKDATMNKDGSFDITAAIPGAGLGDLHFNTDGSASYKIGNDVINFKKLLQVGGDYTGNMSDTYGSSTNPKTDVAFGVTGYLQNDGDVLGFDPISGQVVLHVPKQSGTQRGGYAINIGQLNPGGHLDVDANGGVALFDSSNHELVSATDSGNAVVKTYNTNGSVANTVTYYLGNPGAATSQIAADGSGFITAEGRNETIHFAAGAVVNNVTLPGNIVALTTNIKSSSGVTDTITLTQAYFTNSLSVPNVSVTVNGHTLVDADKITDIYQDKNGTIDIKANVNGFGQSDLRISTDGIVNYTLGKDTLTFAPDILTSFGGGGNFSKALSLVDANGGVDFGLKSAAVGFAEDISWNPTTGKALLNLTNTTTGKTFSSSLGQVNPGEAIKADSNTSIGLYDASGHRLSATKIGTDGSQSDINYNADGSVASIYNYDNKGNLTSSTDNTGTATKYNDASGKLIAFGENHTDGSGYLYSEEGDTLRWVAGTKAASITPTATGTSLNVALTAANGIKDAVSFFGASGLSDTHYLDLTINGHSITDDDVIRDAVMNKDGSFTNTAVTQHFGLSQTTINTDGTGSYKVGNDTISFVAPLAGIYDYAAIKNIAESSLPAVVGDIYFQTYGESILFNADTGQARLIGSSGGGSHPNDFAINIGRVDPGETLKLLSNGTQLVDGAGHVLEAATYSSSGATVTTYNADGSVASFYNYDSAGKLTNSGHGTAGDVVNYSNSKGVVEAFGQTNADGSGYVYFEQGATLRFAAGATKQPVDVKTFDSDVVVATVIAANGVKDEIVGSGGATKDIRDLQLSITAAGSTSGHIHFIQAPVHDVVVDKNGNYTLTAGTNGFGLSTTVINAADNSGSYTIGNDKITFADFGDQIDSSVAQNFLQETNIAFDPNSVVFSTGSGILDFNSNNGQVNLIASSFSQHAINIGQINPGDTLKVGAPTGNVAKIDLVDGSGHLLEETTLNADFTTKVQKFNNNGSVASTLNYDKAGNLQSNSQVAQLVSAMASFGASSGGTTATASLAEVTQPVLAAAH